MVCDGEMTNAHGVVAQQSDLLYMPKNTSENATASQWKIANEANCHTGESSFARLVCMSTDREDCIQKRDTKVSPPLCTSNDVTHTQMCAQLTLRSSSCVPEQIIIIKVLCAPGRE